ncbi:MAG: hypothetical protein OQJ97_16585 [Rhodospirillales bacterium]|nr:hypothetical protein [Rhodospirillales bacterium]
MDDLETSKVQQNHAFTLLSGDVSMIVGRQKFQFILTICLGLILSSCSEDGVDYMPPEGSRDMAITHFSYDNLVIENLQYRYDDFAGR